MLIGYLLSDCGWTFDWFQSLPSVRSTTIVIADPVAELTAGHDRDRQIRERRIAAAPPSCSRAAADPNRAPFVRARSPASSSTASSSPACPGLQVFEQAVGADDRGLVGELAGDVDRLAVGVGRARPADRIEAFEREAQRIDPQVAVGAGGVAFVLRQPLAQRSGR